MTNASGVSVTSSTAISGTKCLTWTATAVADTYVSTGYYPVKPNTGYTVSGWIQVASYGANCYIGLAWYTSAHVLISTSYSNANPSEAGIWQPNVSGPPAASAMTSPGTAAFCKVVLWVNGITAIGQACYADLNYLAPCTVQVLVDWINPAFAANSAAGLDFADLTPWVRLDQGVNIHRGRSDAVSEIMAGSASFTVQNDTGWFTALNTTSPFTIGGGTIGLGARCQINETDSAGNWYTRFDGPLSEIDYQPELGGIAATAGIVVADVLAFMSRQDPLECWTREMVLNAGPWLHWALNDQGNAGSAGVAAESSGNNGPSLYVTQSAPTTTASIAWNNTNGGVESMADIANYYHDGSHYWSPGSITPADDTSGLYYVPIALGPYGRPMGSVYFTPQLTAQSAQNTFKGTEGFYLMAKLPQQFLIPTNQTGVNFTIETWFFEDPGIAAHGTANVGPFITLGLGDSRTGQNLLQGVYLNAGTTGYWTIEGYPQPPVYVPRTFGLLPPAAYGSFNWATGAFDAVPVPRYFVITITGAPAGATVSLYEDGCMAGGQPVGSITLPAGVVFDTITVGAAYGGGGGWFGNISMVSIYNRLLQPEEITRHCHCGLYGMWETTTDNCIAALANYANIPSFWNAIAGQSAGLTLADYVDITGNNALSSMQQYEQAEQGLLYVNAAGQLTFNTRDWRQGYGAPNVAIPPDVYDNSMGYELIDQYVINEASVCSQIYPTGATAVNQASQNQMGVYANGTAKSPTQLPLITWSRAYQVMGLNQEYYWPDPLLSDNAAWQVNSRGVRAVCSSLTVDLMTLDAFSSGLTSANFMALDINNMISLSGTLPLSLPNTTGATELFIEGITETISLTERTIQFYTSPASLQRAWVPGDAVYGILGSTSRIGVSAPDLSTPQALGKDVSHDAGPPYWPPTIAAGMNSPGGISTGGFIGALDIRGINTSLTQMLQPAMCVVAQKGNNQVLPSGVNTNPVINWDTIYVDTAQGMGAVPGYPSWYCCMVPGMYEIEVTVPWTNGSSGMVGMREAFIIVAQQAAQAVAAGVATPLTINTYTCPIGGCYSSNNLGRLPITTASTRIYLGLGDMVACCAEHNQGANQSSIQILSTGSMMSLCFQGNSTAQDQVEINTAIGGSGSSSAPPPKKTNYTSNFNSTGTYSYWGTSSSWSPQLRNTNGQLFQGEYAGGQAAGSQFSFATFNYAAIQSALSGATITGVSVHLTNQHTWYYSGGTLILGYTNATSFGSSFTPGSGTRFWVATQKFGYGQSLWFPLSVSGFGTPFKNGNALALAIGNNSTTSLNYYGYWAGNTSVTLSFKYTK